MDEASQAGVVYQAVAYQAVVLPAVDEASQAAEDRADQAVAGVLADRRRARPVS